MGRSVSTPPNTQAVAYDHIDIEDDDDWWFEDLKEDALYRIQELYPSMGPCSKRLGREDLAIAENWHAWFGLSVYGGLIAYWLVPKTDDPLNEAWVAQVERGFCTHFASLRKLGHMSNGEGVYQRIET